MCRRSCFLPIVAVFGLVSPALGQIIIVDHRPHVPIARSYEIKEVTVDARVRDQAAEVQLGQTFHNPGSVPIEAEFLFPMPEDGAIQNFVLIADGKELPGRILSKEEARRIYENIVRTKRDPALLEYMGRGVFRSSVFPIPPGADRKVTMRYTQLLKRDRDVVEFSYPFSADKFTAKPIERLEMTVRLESQTAIKSLYSPGHDPEIHRSGDHEATIKLVKHDVVPTTDFRLIYTLAEGDVAATVLSTWPSSSEDGYFLLLASPKVPKPDEKPKPKTVVFALDRSGSMSGKKIEQARQSLKFVLNNLKEGDTFNIIAYDDRVETFKPELQRYNDETRSAAARFIENIQAGGSTDIDSALRAALEMLKDDERPSYVLFMTDGLPTAGETRENAIAERAQTANKVHARLFAFGVGYDVNARLLDRLSGAQGGTTEYVRPDEDIEAKVARFFAKMTSPALSRIEIQMSNVDVNRTLPRDIPDLFEGGQLVWVGRYHQAGKTTVKLSGKVGGERHSFESTAELAEPGRGSSYDFVARLWAVRRVGFLIDQIDLHGQNKELTDELVELSKKYGILTPYTSFLADETVPLHASVERENRLRESLTIMKAESGAAGVGQRAAKQSYMMADRAAAPGFVSDGAVMAPATAPMDASKPAAAAPAPSANYGGMASRNRAAGRTPTIVGMSGPSAVGGGGLGGPSVVSGSSSMMMGGYSANAAPGQMAQAKNAEGREMSVANVRQIGSRTFYFRNKRWVDAAVKPEEEAKAKTIVQFTDEYFDLAAKQKGDDSQVLTFTEPVTVKLQGQVYRIDLPKE